MSAARMFLRVDWLTLSKAAVFWLGACLSSDVLFWQEIQAQSYGTIALNNRVHGEIDAPIVRYDGEPPRPGAKAQLFLVQTNGQVVPLWPATTFRTNAPIARYYVQPVIVDTVGVLAGYLATFRVRAWEGADWDSALVRGESNDFVSQTGSVTTLDLNGLEAFVLWPRITQSFSVRVGANLNFLVFAPEFGHVTIQASEDLIQWESISTNTLRNGSAIVSVPCRDSVRSFRAVAQ